MLAMQVVGYVDEKLKERIVRVKRANRRYSESRVIEEALAHYLPMLEGQLTPTQDPPKRKAS